MNKDIKEKVTELFKKYKMDGSITHQFICKFFDTKNIRDLDVLRFSKLNPILRKELNNLLREYFQNNKKEVALEGRVQEQFIGNCKYCNKINNITVPKGIELKFCMKCGKEINYSKKVYPLT